MAQTSKNLLQGWLIIVAVARIYGIYLMWFKPEFYRNSIYTLQPAEATDLHLRLSGIWTSVSLVLCLLCAFDLKSASIRLATLYSFIIAVVHFSSESFVFETAQFTNASSTLLFAVPSIIWLTVDLLKDAFGSNQTVRAKKSK